jgi:hypothetical protein
MKGIITVKGTNVKNLANYILRISWTSFILLRIDCILSKYFYAQVLMCLINRLCCYVCFNDVQ